MALTVSTVFSAGVSANATAGKVDENYISGEMKIITYNVAGLPIPKVFGDGRVVVKDTYEIGKQLSESDFDLIGVQEDFNFHFVLEKMIDRKYKTFTSGGIPAGSGLNLFSKYPIYNVERYKWNKLFGIFDGAADELTPKGILKATIEIENGVYVDVYDIHADADDGEEDINSYIARMDNFKQLVKLINESSKDRAVIVMGDTNSIISKERSDSLYTNLILPCGLKDAWTEVVNKGDYENVDGHRWNKYNSLDRVMYRNGGGVNFEALTHEYKTLNSENDGHSLSDHASAQVTLQYYFDKSVMKKDNTLVKEEFSLAKIIVSYVKGVVLDLGLFVKGLGRVIVKSLKK